MDFINQSNQEKFGLNSFCLKWIAMLTMLVDHVGAVLFPYQMTFRIIGRLAFPIYCFLLVEGAVHTSNWKKYLGRLLIFALISEIPFDLAFRGRIFDWSSQNVFFTLAFGLAAVLILKEWKYTLVSWAGAVLLAFAAELLKTDYGGGGVIIILIFYLMREHIIAKAVCFGAEILVGYGGLESYALFSLFPILCYNGKKGPGGLKYLFYIFYPAHLLLLYFCGLWIHQGSGGF